MISRRYRVIGTGTGAAGEQSTSGRQTGTEGTEDTTLMTDLCGCVSCECARMFIMVRHPNKEPLNSLFTLSEHKLQTYQAHVSRALEKFVDHARKYTL